MGLTSLGFFWGRVDAWADQEPARAERKIAQIDEDITTEAAAVDEAQYNYERVRANIGEGCVALVERYLPGNVLEETPEDTMVADINTGSNAACGEDPVDIRTNIRNIFAAHEAAGVANVNLTQARDDRLQEIEDNKSGTIGTKIIFGGLGNLLFSGFVFFGSVAGARTALDAVRPKGRSERYPHEYEGMD